MRNEVSLINPLDAQEQKDIAWILSENGLQKPENRRVHLGAYCALFDPSSQSLLLADHKKAGLWMPPGGHMEKGEHPRQTVVRETREELNTEALFLINEPLFFSITQTEKDLYVALWYLLKGTRGTCFDYCEKEFSRLEWFRKDEVPFDSAVPHLKRFVQKIDKTFK